MRKKFGIITHHDADGQVGALVALRHLEIKYDAKPDDVDIIVDDLTGNVSFDIMYCKKEVIIVDHPYVPELEDYVENIFWFDHHGPMVNDERYKNVPGLRSITMAGCELAYLYLFNPEYVEYVRKYPANTRADNRINAMREIAPLLVYYIGDNDNWDKNTGKNGWNAFIGANSLPTIDKDLSAWTKFLDNYWASKYVYALERYGEACDLFIKTHSEKLVTSRAFECTFTGYPEAKAIALNTDMRGSNTFDAVKDQYDIGVVFFIGKSGKYTVNVYNLTGDESKFDLGAACKKLGGGGHKGAAGCTVDELSKAIIRKGR